VDPTNLCGVYKNTISVYGRHLSPVGEQLLAQVTDTLDGEQQRLADEGLVRLTTLDSLTGQQGNYGDPNGGFHALSFAVKAAIAIFAIALLAGVATFALYIYLERKKYQQERPRHSHHKRGLKKVSSNRTLGCEEASQASAASETVGLGAGTAVVLEDGRPVVIEFGKEFQRKKKDSIEETRSECGNTTLSGTPGSSPKYVRNKPRRGREESKFEDVSTEPDRHAFPTGGLSADRGSPVDPMSHSMYSEYTEHTATSEQVRNGEFT
jgi:hypothetical protein